MPPHRAAALAASFHGARVTLAARELRKAEALARELGVRGTPTWFVDGFPVMGDLPLGYARHFIETRLPG